MIATAVGHIAIEAIEAGDWVWATNPETGETALKQVVQLFRNETSEWVHVTVGDETITCTPEHPFYSPVKGWTNAIDLRAGDILVMLNGEYVVVEQVQHELFENSEITYNFEVEDFHTYYVGSTELLVHNSCGADHGNSLSTKKPAEGYILKDLDTHEILKYGETTRGPKRYSQSYLKKHNAYMEFVASGTKAQMHAWQHKMIEGYVSVMGQLPPLNLCLW